LYVSALRLKRSMKVVTNMFLEEKRCVYIIEITCNCITYISGLLKIGELVQTLDRYTYRYHDNFFFLSLTTSV
jgi:hypothetical protein